MQATSKPYYLNYRHSRTGWSCRAEFETLTDAISYRIRMGLDRHQCRIMSQFDGCICPVFPIPRNPS